VDEKSAKETTTMTDINAEAITDNATQGADATRPPGLSDEEWRLVCEHRERQAEELRRAAPWKLVFGELFDLAQADAAARWDDEKAWSQAAELFVQRSKCVDDWGDDTLRVFVKALMRAVGFREKPVRGHGVRWEEPD
jgi:hypothetical protein